MMETFRHEVESVLRRAGVRQPKLEKPKRPEMGDLAFPCFELAKRKRKDPKQVADEIALKLKQTGHIKLITAIGPYVNFFADWKRLGGPVINAVLRQRKVYGMATGKAKERPAKAGKVMVEFAHPNTHKAFHIGHVRNITLGESLSRILEAAGFRVIRANYQGDIGPHVARCLWGVLNLGLREPKDDKGKWLGEVYAQASQRTSDPVVELEMKEINKALYAGKPDLAKLWKRTRKWSLDYFKGIYRDFGTRFDRLYFESEVEGPSIKLAKSLLKRRVAKISDGAIVMDLEKHKLGVYVLLTRDGTPLYSIKDFILADMQYKEYKPSRIIHVVGSEQELHFRQLFKSLEMTNRPLARIEQHLSYGLVNLESGKMKSREGQVILYEELLARLLGIARRVTHEKNPKLPQRQKEQTARAVAMGALRYDMIKVSPEKTIVFDWDRALSFEGNNAPYLQYTHARCCSILRKADVKSLSGFNAGLLRVGKEIALLKIISELPALVAKSARELRPHYLATYAYNLCDAFNEFYQFVPVIKAKHDVSKARLALVKAVQITLRNALRLLGIEAPEQM